MTKCKSALSIHFRRIEEKKIFNENLHPYIQNAISGIVSNDYTDDSPSQTYIKPTYKPTSKSV